jgi:mannose-6-phosphate isomerase-like protein (cupin superfamily)
MYRHIPAGELEPTPGGTIVFEGGGFGSDVSVYLVNTEPGGGPDLHRHPYSETWIVRSGLARMTADGASFEARPGDIVVVEPNVPHLFKNAGTERLEITCIHASPVFVQEELT